MCGIETDSFSVSMTSLSLFSERLSLGENFPLLRQGNLVVTLLVDGFDESSQVVLSLADIEEKRVENSSSVCFPSCPCSVSTFTFVL